MLSRAAIESHSIDIRQFIDFRQSTLVNGMRAIDVHNGSGLTFTLLPDRGMDIWAAHYHGLPLTWMSQASPHAPDFGAPWLRLFNGGLLTTCGLTHVGAPETDSVTGEYRDIHGDYTRLRAYDISTSGGWQGDKYIAELKCLVSQAMLFSEQLRVQRTYRITLGEPTIEIIDTVENLYDVPAPLMLLYHFNVGYPLVREGAQLIVPTQATYPRDEAARKGIEHWAHYGGATAGHHEEVFFHHVKADENHFASAALLNTDFGLQFDWDTTHAAYLTQWKNLRRGIYVCGIEPGNCVPEGLNTARAKGSVTMLQPGAAQTFTNRVHVLHGATQVDACRASLSVLEEQGHPVTNCDLTNYAD